MMPHPESMLRPDEQRWVLSCAKQAASDAGNGTARALEIGTGYGGTAALLADAGMSVLTVDHFEAGNHDRAMGAIGSRCVGHVYGPAGPASSVAIARQQLLLPLGPGQVLVAHMPSDVILPLLVAAQRTYQLVLVDGDHERGVLEDLQDASKLVAPGGVLLVDDVANGHPTVTAAVLHFLAGEPAGRWDVEAIEAFAEACSSTHRLSKLVVLRCRQGR